MIDEKKYEGHTPAPWWLVDDQMDSHLLIRANENEQLVYMTEDLHLAKKVDWELIADAPLLLEAYKRLRGLLDVIVDITLKELEIFDDNCPMINIRDLAYKGILWRDEE